MLASITSQLGDGTRDRKLGAYTHLLFRYQLPDVVSNVALG
jgi:hypothetical protein